MSLKKQFYIKCLNGSGGSIHNMPDPSGRTGDMWDRPKPDGTPGEWRPPVAGNLKPHHKGYHLAKSDHLIGWFTGENYLAEADGTIVEGYDCVVSETARLVKPLPMTDKDWQNLCLTWVKDIKDMMQIIGFPAQWHETLNRAYDQVFNVLMTADNVTADDLRHAREACQFAEFLGYRAEKDGKSGSEFIYNSKAASSAAKAVSTLQRILPNAKNLKINFAMFARDIASHAADAVDYAVLHRMMAKGIGVSDKPVPCSDGDQSLAPNIRARRTLRQKQNTDLLRALKIDI